MKWFGTWQQRGEATDKGNTRVCRRRSSVLLTALLGLGLSATSLPASSAHAQLSGCRSDPVVTLSNLAQIDLQAQISDSTSDVQSIVYVVHAPVGTSLVSVVKTGSLLGLKEVVKFYADNPAGTYDTYTTAYTGQKGISVTAYTTVVSALDLTLSAPTIAGLSGQSLHAHVSGLL